MTRTQESSVGRKWIEPGVVGAEAEAAAEEAEGGEREAPKAVEAPKANPAIKAARGVAPMRPRKRAV